MTLTNIIDIIREACEAQPNFGQFNTGSVYDVMNTRNTSEYRAFVLTERRHTLADESTYRFVLFCIDRPLSDRSDVDERKSEALETLKQIRLILQERFDVDITLSSTTFEERFSDLCVGAYAEFEITIPEDYVCGYNF